MCCKCINNLVRVCYVDMQSEEQTVEIIIKKYPTLFKDKDECLKYVRDMFGILRRQNCRDC